MKVTFSERSACAKFEALSRLFFVGGFLCSRFEAWGLGFRLRVLVVFFGRQGYVVLSAVLV